MDPVRVQNTKTERLLYTRHQDHTRSYHHRSNANATHIFAGIAVEPTDRGTRSGVHGRGGHGDNEGKVRGKL